MSVALLLALVALAVLGNRVVLAFPGDQTATQMAHVLEALFDQDIRCSDRAAARATVQHNFVGVLAPELAKPILEPAQRDMSGALDVTGLPFIVLAYIDQGHAIATGLAGDISGANRLEFLHPSRQLVADEQNDKNDRHRGEHPMTG